jgi:hypothetical protein
MAGPIGGIRYRLIPYLGWLDPVDHKKLAKVLNDNKQTRRSSGDRLGDSSHSVDAGGTALAERGSGLFLGRRADGGKEVRSLPEAWVTSIISTARIIRVPSFRDTGFRFAESSVQFLRDWQLSAHGRTHAFFANPE